MQAYYAAVTFMDKQVGVVLDELTALGLDDETIIVFTSDHGYHLGEHTMWQKLSLHEESARVPLIVAGPGIAVNQVTTSLAELVDLYPTMADLCGLTTPSQCQGVSLRSVLEDPNAVVRNSAYCEVNVNNGKLLRTSQYAYMRYSGGAEELYDMILDPQQYTNLATDPSHAGDKAQLSALLDQRLLDMGDPLVSITCDPANLHFGLDYTKLDQSSLGSPVGSGLHLEVTDGPSGQFGFVLIGAGGSAAIPQYNGILCLEFPVARYNGNVAANQGLPELDSIGQFDAAGIFQNLAGTATSSGGSGFDVPAQLPFLPSGQFIVPGDTWYFQVWFRDLPTGSANWSNVAQVHFP